MFNHTLEGGEGGPGGGTPPPPTVYCRSNTCLVGGAGLHEKETGLRGGPRGGWVGGGRGLPKRLGVVAVGYKCH